MTDKKHITAELSRELSLFHITMMGLGMMIGAGVFIGVGISIRKVGPGGLVLTFALNGVIALLTAMSFAELSSAIPHAGGAYNFARIGFGRGTSFLAGWMEWFASSVAGSLYAVVFATYTLNFFVQLGLMTWLPVPIVVAQRVVALAAAAFFIYINYRGASETGRIGALFTLGQMFFVLSIAVIGIAVAIADPSRVQNFRPFLPYGWSKLLVTMGFVYVAFEGFEVIAQTGDEVVDPKRNIPKAMLYSVYIVTLTYVAVSFATVVAVKAGTPGVDGAPWEWIGRFGDTGFGAALSKLMPTEFVGPLLVTLAVLFSSTSALNATVYSAARASYALGRDGMLPAVFSKISSRRNTPWGALLFTSVIVLVVAGALPTEHVASCASMMFLFLFFLVNLCVIRIRTNMGDELSYGFVMPLFPLFPILALLCQAVLAVNLHEMSRIAWILGPAWVLAGAAIYVGYSRYHAIATEDEIQVLEEEQAPVGDEYRVMVAVANPENALALVRNTYRLCGAKKARIELLHMIEVPDQVPLTDAEEYMLRGKEGIVEAMLYLLPRFPISTTVRYCRNMARGIVSAVREKKIDMLIMGWHGQPKAHEFRLGSTIDPIIERTPCNVVIFKQCSSSNFKRILIPLAGGPNGALALEVASILAVKGESELVAFSVATETTRFDIEAFVKEHHHRLYVPPEQVRTKVVTGRNVVGTILEEAQNYDLIVIGATREPLINQVTRGSIPETIARACEKPLVMVKASGGVRSWVKRWI